MNLRQYIEANLLDGKSIQVKGWLVNPLAMVELVEEWLEARDLAIARAVRAYTRQSIVTFGGGVVITDEDLRAIIAQVDAGKSYE